MDVTQIRLCSLEESLELVNCRRHLTNLQKEKKKTYTKMMLLIKNVDSSWYVPYGAWCSGPFAIAAISIHPYLPSWLVPDRSLRHGHSNVCVIHICKCVCEGGKDVFFSARNYFFFTKSLSRARVCTTLWLSVDCVGRAYVARGWHLCRYYGGPFVCCPHLGLHLRPRLCVAV